MNITDHFQKKAFEEIRKRMSGWQSFFLGTGRDAIILNNNFALPSKLAKLGMKIKTIENEKFLHTRDDRFLFDLIGECEGAEYYFFHQDNTQLLLRVADKRIFIVKTGELPEKISVCLEKLALLDIGSAAILK